MVHLPFQFVSALYLYRVAANNMCLEKYHFNGCFYATVLAHGHKEGARLLKARGLGHSSSSLNCLSFVINQSNHWSLFLVVNLHGVLSKKVCQRLYASYCFPIDSATDNLFFCRRVTPKVMPTWFIWIRAVCMILMQLQATYGRYSTIFPQAVVVPKKHWKSLTWVMVSLNGKEIIFACFASLSQQLC